MYFKCHFLYTALLFIQGWKGSQCCPSVEPPTKQTTIQTSSTTTALPPYDYSKWPCTIHNNRTSKIYGESDAIAGTFPFYVAAKGSQLGAGVIINNRYVLTDRYIFPNKIAHSLQPGDKLNDLFSSTNPNVIAVEKVFLIPGSPGLLLLRLASPIPYGPLARPALISDCSGPSKPIMGESLAYFGLGDVAYETKAETMQVGCSQVIDVPYCTFSEQPSFCVTFSACWHDYGGPIVTIENDQVYLVGIILSTSNSCNGPVQIPQGLVCEGYQEIQNIFEEEQP